MIPLPSVFPSDALTVLITAVKEKNFKSTDAVTATWNLVGYGGHLGFGRLVAGGAGEEIDDISDEQALAMMEAIQANSLAAEPMGAEPVGVSPGTVLAIIKWAIKLVKLIPV